jgi:uncharacterized integral membrane protein (TIGR00698 family)
MGIKKYLPGIALALTFALVSLAVTQHPTAKANGVSPLVVAIILGLIYGNTFYGRHREVLFDGLCFSQQKLLRAGVALYGLNISFVQIAELGWSVVLLNSVIIILVMFLGIFIGRRLLGLDRTMAVLVAIGAAICGAAAVLAAGPVTRANGQQVAMAVATVVLFGTIAMFVYPLIYPLLPLDAAQYGIYAGSTVHEVAQVVAAGVAVSPEAADTGVIVKLIRVMLLAPTLILVGLWMRGSGDGNQKLYIPWFVFVFIVISAINTWMPLPETIHNTLVKADIILLSMAMAALGMDTNFEKLKHLGPKPFLLASILFVVLLIGGLGLNLWLVPA